MIQRVQTLYLLLTGVLMAITLFFPLLAFQAEGEFYKMDAFRIAGQMGAETFSTIGLFFVGALSALLALVSIFFYKKRSLQIKLTMFNIFLMVAFVAYVLVLGFNFSVRLNAEWRPAFAMALPVISIILSWLAIKGIRADEALVRSLDRIR